MRTFKFYRHKVGARVLPAMLASTVGGAALFGTACLPPLPDPQLVISARVLAIQTQVTTPLPFVEEDPGAAPRAQALPFEGVTITPFIVGPQGPFAPDEVDPVWIACEMSPGQGLFGCISEGFPLALEDIPACPAVDISSTDIEDPPPTVSPCVIGREFAPEFTVPFSQNLFVGGDLELTMIAGAPGGTDTDRCAAELLAGENQLPNDCIFAVQRLSLGPVEAMLALLAEFGIEIEGLEPPPPEEIPDADRNPRIEKIEYVLFTPTANGDEVEAGERIEVNSGDSIDVAIGDTIRVYTTSPEGDLQSFPVPVNNGESFEQQQESYSGSWFITWGQLLSGSSDDLESFNELTLAQGAQDESETPPDDQGHIYYVLSDGRQGVNWWSLRLNITPDP